MPPKRKRVTKESEPEEQPVAKKPRLAKKAASKAKKDDIEQIEDQPTAKGTVKPKLTRGSTKSKSVIEENKEETPTKPKPTRGATQIFAPDPDDLWGNILPDEILFQVFTFLRRHDLWKCRFVNNRWGQLTRDDALGWHTATDMLFVEHLLADGPNNGGKFCKRKIQKLNLLFYSIFIALRIALDLFQNM